MKTIFLVLFSAISVISCGLKEEMKKNYTKADKTFADQNFKNAIANIELYKIRHGVYPETLKAIDYTSVFDSMNDSSVIYERLESGYRLDIGKGIFSRKQMHLSYPAGFWEGLGIKESNVMSSRSELPEGIKKIK